MFTMLSSYQSLSHWCIERWTAPCGCQLSDQAKSLGHLAGECACRLLLSTPITDIIIIIIITRAKSWYSFQVKKVDRKCLMRNIEHCQYYQCWLVKFQLWC